MSNPLIDVLKALYGAPGSQIEDVTNQVQGIFDAQYNTNNNSTQFVLTRISPELFNIPDPAPGKVKTFTVVYNATELGSAAPFMRGGQDGSNLTLTVGPVRTVTVVKAVYATNTSGFDVTDRLNAYLADPGNSTQLQVGSQPFWNALTDGYDPAPNVIKYFSATFTTVPNGPIKQVCGFDKQKIDLI